MLLLKAFFQVVLITLSLCALVYVGYFDEVFVELGKEHYAEETNLVRLFPSFRHWLHMPLNTLVCFGYLLVGIHWLVKAEDLLETKTVSYVDAYVMTVFNWMAVFYGPLQCIRIVTQLHPFAVLDQWVTLPFFAWVVVWSWHCNRSKGQSWSNLFPVTCVGLSLLSYCLTLVHKYGFEIILGVHILGAVFTGLKAYHRYANKTSLASLQKGVVCCVGFVVLKLLDLEMKKIHWIFSIASGHFLSKVCDVLQIHYVNSFFLNIVLTRNSTEQQRVKKKIS